jgi:hypothetical protein
MVPDARVFSSMKNEQKYSWLYDSVVHQGYLCKFCELCCGHSSSSQEFVTVGINLGRVWLLFYYWTSKLINVLLFPSFRNSHHSRANFPYYKARWAFAITWRPSVCPSYVVNFHILIFSPETTGTIATKLWWNGPWMAPFQNCVRWSRLPTKISAKIKIEKRGDEILIVHCCFSISQNELKF